MAKIAFFILVFCSCYCTVCFPQATGTSDTNKMFRAMKQQAEDIEKKHLEALKKQNPDKYQKVLERKKLRGQISEIVAKYHRKSIPYDVAKSQLRPFIKKYIKNENKISNLDSKISNLEKRIIELKRMRQDPDYFIDKEIDKRLGKVSSLLEDFEDNRVSP
ncbi:MAG: hypothetical protein GY858_07985 [Candidatus Omnitrophica bacterium]|nr:hypothetical protein [Candidatus Omnitrophota bacterium]